MAETDGCSVASTLYSAADHGCLYLLSSGTGSGKVTGEGVSGTHLVGASEDLKDVFVQTSDLLTPATDHAAHIYDVREGGGFAQPVSVPCEAEGCRGPAATPPPSSTPGSSTFSGPGNAREGHRHRRRHHKRHHRRARANRRAHR
jgi:hypothetical protein